MIEFEKLRFKNFLSYGNYMTELELNKHKMNIITAVNGSGKSASFDAIVFGLFGRAYRKINKPLLINSINNKGLLVEIEFTVNDRNKKTRYKVVRGIKPNIFEIYENDEKMDEVDSTRDQQKILEDDILKTNYRTFIQIVILGSGTYIPFMHLTPNQRREFIENLLDIDIFSTMNSMLKSKYSILKDLENYNRTKQQTHEERVAGQKQFIRKLESQYKDEEASNSEEIDDLLNRISQEKERKEHVETLINELKEQIDKDREKELKSKISEIQEIISDKNAEIRKINKDVDFIRTHDECPTCNREIDSEYRQEFIEDSYEVTGYLQHETEQRSEELDKLKEQLNERIDKKEKLKTYKTRLDYHEKTLQQYENDLTQKRSRKRIVSLDDIEQEQRKLDSLESKQEEFNEQKEFLKEKRNLFDTASVLLKDTGIKARIVSQYIPIINKLINQYLGEMNFNVTFTLDETFSEQILSRHRDKFTYDNFSNGEKMRIDIALLMVWRNIAEMKNSIHTNLLLMDEVFDSSLDENGIEDFLKILSNLTKRNNIYIISHKIDNLTEKFDRSIVVEKSNDFSYLIENTA